MYRTSRSRWPLAWWVCGFESSRGHGLFQLQLHTELSAMGWSSLREVLLSAYTWSHSMTLRLTFCWDCTRRRLVKWHYLTDGVTFEQCILLLFLYYYTRSQCAIQALYLRCDVSNSSIDNATLPEVYGKHMEMIRDSAIEWENCTSSYSWTRKCSRLMVSVSGWVTDCGCQWYDYQLCVCEFCNVAIRQWLCYWLFLIMCCNAML